MGGRHPARWEPEGRSPGLNPRSVPPGIENQTPLPDACPGQVEPINMPPEGIHVRLDWMRLVGSDAAFHRVHTILCETFGQPTSDSIGAKWFRGGINWHPGVMLSYGHSSGIVQVDIRGERMTIIGTDSALELMRRIYDLNGFKATRLDGAVDFVGPHIELFRNALHSCKNGELCRLRSFGDKSEYTSSMRPTQILLYMGKRDSPVIARIYDKGLEMKLAPIGIWERLEIEFKEDRASTLAITLLESPDAWPRIVTEVVFGAIDFRVRNGRSELKRRPRAEWWDRIVDGIECRPIPPMPGVSSFAAWWEWCRTSFGARFLQVAEILDRPPATLLPLLLRELTPAETESAATVELRAMLAGGRLPSLLDDRR